MRRTTTILILVLSALAANVAHAAITFDASSTISSGAFTATTTFGTITVGNGANEAMVMTLATSPLGGNACGSAANAATITVGGQTATQIVAATTTNTRGESMYYLTAVPAGIQGVTTTCTSAPNGGVTEASSWFGVSQSSPIDATSSFATTTAGVSFSNSISTANYGDMIIDGASTRGVLTSASAGQTVVSTSTAGTTGATNGGSSFKAATAPGSYSMGWNQTNFTWQQAMVALRPAPFDPLFLSSD